MQSRPGILFTFDDGREIAVPCPSAERMAAVFALTPAPGGTETAPQFISRLIRQADTLLETALWVSRPAGAATPVISAALLSLAQARQLTNACMAHFVGADARAFTRSTEAKVAAAGWPELQSVPLGELLTFLSR